MVTNHLIDFHFVLLFGSYVWFYFRTLNFPASVSWTFRQGQTWTPSCVLGLKTLDQSFFRWPLSLSLRHHFPSTSCAQNRLWINGFVTVGVPVPPMGTLSGYRKWSVQDLNSPLLTVLTSVTRNFPTAPGFYITP